MWCVAEITPEYRERMHNLLKLYACPYNRFEPVVCFDEKPKQLLAETRLQSTVGPGKIARRDQEYRRCGVVNIFAAFEPLRGNPFLLATEHRKAVDFAHALEAIAKKYSKALVIHLVLDNLNTHSIKSLVTAFGQKKALRLWSRFKIHYTPKHASWLNQAELLIGNFSRGALGKIRFETIQEIQAQLDAWVARHRWTCSTNWKFTVRDAKRKFPIAL